MEYTLGELKTITNKGIQGKIGMLTDVNGTMDTAVRNIVTHPRLKLSSTIKVESLIPAVGDETNRFKAPDHINGTAIIDIMKRGVSFNRSYGLSMTTPEQFHENSSGYLNREVAIEKTDGEKYVYFYDDETPNYIFDNLDHVGDWVVTGNATDLRADKGEFKVGIASLNFDITAGGTEAGIKVINDNGMDISDEIATDGEVFVWAFIPNVEKIPSIILRIGSSESDYHQLSTSTRYDGTALKSGWNLISFSLVDMPDTGTPDDTSIVYMNLSMSINDLAYSALACRFDNIVIHRGRPFDAKFYSLNVWRDAITLEEKQSASNDSDILMIDAEEWPLICQSALTLAADEADIEDQKVLLHQNKLDRMIVDYYLKNPSRALTMITNYHKFD